MKNVFFVTISSLILVTASWFWFGEAYAGDARGSELSDVRYFHHAAGSTQLHGALSDSDSVDTPAILFIHGTPGSWQAWERYLNDPELRDTAKMIAIDRPGFSRLKQKELSLKKQASLIMGAALSKHDGTFIVVGHSYGGAIQLQMAIDYPNRIAGMVILAGAIDPDLQAARWYHHLGNTWLGRLVLPKTWEITTQEMLSLPAELERQQPGLSNIRTQIVMVQGGKDWLVPKGNVDYAKEHLANASLQVMLLPERGHFLPWMDYELSKKTIIKMVTQS